MYSILNTKLILSINCPTKDTVPASPDPKVISGCSTANTSALPAVYSFNWIAPLVALTKVCAAVSLDVPTFNVIVVAVTAWICNLVWKAASATPAFTPVPLALG